MDTGITDEHLKHRVEFSKMLECDTKKSNAKKKDLEFGVIRDLHLSCVVEGYLPSGYNSWSVQ